MKRSSRSGLKCSRVSAQQLSSLRGRNVAGLTLIAAGSQGNLSLHGIPVANCQDEAAFGDLEWRRD